VLDQGAEIDLSLGDELPGLGKNGTRGPVDQEGDAVGRAVRADLEGEVVVAEEANICLAGEMSWKRSEAVFAATSLLTVKRTSPLPPFAASSAANRTALLLTAGLLVASAVVLTPN
jgi:hypothetical protein